jgi:hypothetical protein
MAAPPGRRPDIVEGEHTRRHANSQRPARIRIRSERDDTCAIWELCSANPGLARAGTAIYWHRPAFRVNAEPSQSFPT